MIANQLATFGTFLLIACAGIGFLLLAGLFISKYARGEVRVPDATPLVDTPEEAKARKEWELSLKPMVRINGWSRRRMVRLFPESIELQVNLSCNCDTCDLRLQEVECLVDAAQGVDMQLNTDSEGIVWLRIARREDELYQNVLKKVFFRVEVC